jgi:hypothetical protein
MTARPIVLFVGNDASSTQIAESLLRRLVGDRVEIRTAGAQRPDPGGREDQMLVMMGLNPAHEEPLSIRALNTSDRVVILGTTLDVARVPGRRYEEWDLDDSSLDDRVHGLAAELLSTVCTPVSVAEPQVRRAGRRRLVGQRIRRRVRARVDRHRDELARRLASVRRRRRRRSS